jgi:hypothetical protein
MENSNFTAMGASELNGNRHAIFWFRVDFHWLFPGEAAWLLKGNQGNYSRPHLRNLDGNERPGNLVGWA